MKRIDAQKTDSQTWYFNLIKDFTVLSPEEEIAICKRIKELKNKVELKGLTLTKINEEIEKNGIKTSGNLSNKIFSLNKLIVELENKENIDNKKINELKLLLNNAKLYNSYEDLIKRFTEHNLKLVISIANHYTNRGVEFLDLIQEGNAKLKQIILTFDVEKEYKFSTYATKCLRRTMERIINKQGKSYSVPAQIQDIADKIGIIEKDYQTKYFRKPSDDEILTEFYMDAKRSLEEEGISNPTKTAIMKKANVDFEKIQLAKKVRLQVESLDKPLGEDEDYSIMDVLIDNDQTPTDSITDEVDYKNFIKQELNNFKPKAKLIVILRFNLNLEEYMTYDEFEYTIKMYSNIADKLDIKELYDYSKSLDRELKLEEIGEMYFGVTRERIRQEEAKTLCRIKRRNKNYKELGLLD